MIENRHGFKPGDIFDLGGLNWTIYAAESDSVKCITTNTIREGGFDNISNNFAHSIARLYLDKVMQELIDNGVPEKIFKEFEVDLTSDDGLNGYKADKCKIGLLTCDEYRKYRVYIPKEGKLRRMMATPRSIPDNCIKGISRKGRICSINIREAVGISPVCEFDSAILRDYLERKADHNTKKDEYLYEMIFSCGEDVTVQYTKTPDKYSYVYDDIRGKNLNNVIIKIKKYQLVDEK